MKIAHFIGVSPHQSGMYETTRELVLAERNAGLESLIYDTSAENTGICKIDRGVYTSTLDEVEEADIYMLHSQFPDHLYKSKKPKTILLHGAPEYVFHGEVLNNANGERGYSTLLGYMRENYFKSALTLWDRHIPYWQEIFDNVEYCPSFIDTSVYNADVEPISIAGCTNETLKIGYVDSWRATFFQDPFRIATGVAHYWRSTKDDVKLTFYGFPSNRDIVYDRAFNRYKENTKYIGSFVGNIPDMNRVYPSLDLIITNNVDESRVVKEALCSGCPILAPLGAKFTEYTCDIADPTAISEAITKMRPIIENLDKKRLAKKSIERYNLKNTEKFLIDFYERLLCP